MDIDKIPLWKELLLKKEAKELETLIKEYEVGLSELDTMKNKRGVYAKKSNTWFKERRDRTVQVTQEKKRNAEERREEIGNILRSINLKKIEE